MGGGGGGAAGWFGLVSLMHQPTTCLLPLVLVGGVCRVVPIGWVLVEVTAGLACRLPRCHPLLLVLGSQSTAFQLHVIPPER